MVLTAATLARELVRPENLLSLARLPLAAILWVAPDQPAFLMATVACAGATDWLDGVVARRRHRRPPLGTAHVGAWLDPICDKVFVLSCTVAIVVTWRPPSVLLPLLLFRDVCLLVLTPAFRILAGAERFHRHDYRSRPSGKIVTVLQFTALAAVVFAPGLAMPLAALAAGCGWWAVAERVHLALPEWQPQ